MRGIVTLAAALAIPETLPGGARFPHRDFILLTAFCVVLGTLLLQGLTLRPLLVLLDLHDDDPVGREVGLARAAALRAALAAIDGDRSPAANALRREYAAVLAQADKDPHGRAPAGLPADDLRRRAVVAARQATAELRRRGEIGDEAFHRLENELDWAEMNAGSAPGSDA
jgi:CPA1 family monovalent cation:H+ antiporter